jgi:hypothetical protein
MIDMEEQVEVHFLFDMVEKELDIIKDVMNEYKLDLLMSQLKHLKLVLLASVHDDQMNSVKNNEPVVRHHMHPKKLDIVDQLMNNMMDHCLTLDHYRMKSMVMVLETN